MNEIYLKNHKNQFYYGKIKFFLAKICALSDGILSSSIKIKLFNPFLHRDGLIGVNGRITYNKL